jgi:hypothetical protein
VDPIAIRVAMWDSVLATLQSYRSKAHKASAALALTFMMSHMFGPAKRAKSFIEIC